MFRLIGCIVTLAAAGYGVKVFIDRHVTWRPVQANATPAPARE